MIQLPKAHFFRYLNGAPGRIRTSDPQIRSLVLYPAELRARAGLLTAQSACGQEPVPPDARW